MKIVLLALVGLALLLTALSVFSPAIIRVEIHSTTVTLSTSKASMAAAKPVPAEIPPRRYALIMLGCDLVALGSVAATLQRRLPPKLSAG